jgi:PAS domain S-box-containing protein
VPIERPTESVDFELSFATARPFDFHAWREMWRREYVFFHIDAQQRIDFIAPSVRDILGYDPEELLGCNYRDVFDLNHPLTVQLAELSNQGYSFVPPSARPSVVRRKNGEIAVFDLRERDVITSLGSAGKELMGQDVTARVQAELSLRDSEQKYRRLVEGVQSDYVLYARDAAGVVTYVSPSIERVLGFRPEELIGRPAIALYAEPVESRSAAGRFVQEALAGKQLLRVVVPVRHRSGSVRTMEVQERPLFGVDGQLVAMEGIAKDITDSTRASEELRALKEDLERRVALRTDELSRMNEELRASHARYRDVVDTQTEFIVRWRPDGTRTFVNEAYCRFQDASQAELLGSPFIPLIHPDDRAALVEDIARIIPENPSHFFEGRVQRREGPYVWMQWETHGFFDEQGRPVEYQSVGRDVTQLKAASDLLRQKEAHLAHLSRLATMGEMVAGIAHEISQPLHAAKTFAEAARRNLQNAAQDRIDRAVECMNEISQAITRTVQIIRRLREFTKAQPFQRESLQVNQLVRESLELVSHEFRRLGATVQLQLAQALPQIAGDRIQLEQLLVNLLKNACEAMDQTPLDERILTVRTNAGEQGVRLEVRDSGVGISESTLQHLFEAFYTTKAEGMGMGLALAKSIADAHGMSLGFKNNAPARGATAVLIIPVAPANHEPDERPRFDPHRR